jgi:cation:H+ antiporter
MIPSRAVLELPWQRRVAAAAACAVAGVLAVAAGQKLPPLLFAALLTAGMLGASLLLAWAVGVTTMYLSGRLVIAAAAIVSGLSGLTAQVHLAFTQQAQYATANVTGSARLDLSVAIALPAVGAVMLRGRGHTMTSHAVDPARRLDLAVLALAAAVALTVSAAGRLTVIQGLTLGALYALYALRGQGSADDPTATIGVTAAIAALGPASRRRVCGVLFIVGAIAVFMTAGALPDGLLRAGQVLGIRPYLLIQTIIPLATEAPELVVAGTLTFARRPAQGLMLLLASSVIETTLAPASTSVAYLLGGGGWAMPLAGGARIDMLLTAAVTLTTVAALASPEPERADGWIVATAFGIQALFPESPVRLFVALALLTFAADIFHSERQFLPASVVTLPRRTRPLTRM